MLISRILPRALRSPCLTNAIRNSPKRFISTSAVRSHGQWSYRAFAPHNMLHERIADVCGAFMWWWIFWHVFTDYHHIIGHYDFPDTSAWTDEELGIPPDDADDPE